MDIAEPAPQEDTAAIRAEILERLTGFMGGETHKETGVAGLSVYRVTQPSGPLCGVYEPSLSFIIQGSKRIYIGDQTILYDASRFLITSVGLPTVAQIQAASEEEPYFCMVIKLDLKRVRQIIADIDIQPTEMPQVDLGMALGTATVDLFDALRRLVALTDTPRHIPFLATQIENEILYRLLTGEQGMHLRRIALVGTQSNRVAKAVEWLKQNFTQPLRVEDLADIASMGVSTLHHHFRAMTAMSPLQYQKHLRLNEARILMLSNNLDAATAALRVGYESPTQFNREYRRLFGAPPMRDIKAIRALDRTRTPANQETDLSAAG
ncbi:AraC family transcriptional regulator N-terminal domain-containing protein [Lacibacterium aquatile]|uniref:AraC family transcriptional regulator N-terminal domain-containing protein n=1 Tax=Lacibacterium aquatile TaxID=1168082 RepID=A0ABW5DP58_9PROT